jgi:peptide deformylase
MTIREIITPPNPILREKAKKVRAFSNDLEVLIADMIETLRAAPGVGLAAPQVAVGERVIIVEFGENSGDPETPPKPPKLYIVINPEITRRAKETELGVEGCLSIPGYLGEVERSLAVTVKGLNRKGEPYKLKAKNWLARIFQHEIDHLNGVLFIDRADKVWRLEEVPEPGEAREPSHAAI